MWSSLCLLGTNCSWVMWLMDSAHALRYFISIERNVLVAKLIKLACNTTRHRIFIRFRYQSDEGFVHSLWQEMSYTNVINQFIRTEAISSLRALWHSAGYPYKSRVFPDFIFLMATSMSGNDTEVASCQHWLLVIWMSWKMTVI